VSKNARWVSSPQTFSICLRSTRAGARQARGMLRKNAVSDPKMRPKSTWKKTPSFDTIMLSVCRSPRPRMKDMANQHAHDAPNVCFKVRIWISRLGHFHKYSSTPPAAKISLRFSARSTTSTTAMPV